MLGWAKRCKLTHAFLWEYSFKRLGLAQRLGQLGVFLTLVVCLVARQASCPIQLPDARAPFGGAARDESVMFSPL